MLRLDVSKKGVDIFDADVLKHLPDFLGGIGDIRVQLKILINVQGISK